ncbi:MAG: SdiA-regulated domain-containing protein [Spirochaetales bacterium]|nr:SdiA-regulated domain-containing protein [Spirochaetales bacterium]
MVKKNIINSMIPVVSILALIFIIYWILSSSDDKKNVTNTYQKSTLSYQLMFPEKTIILPPELMEISGISYYRKKELVCISDESGKIYIINYETGEVTGAYEFGKERDYEDIAVMEDMFQDMETKIYILRSCGKIYRIKRLGAENQKIKEYNTFLPKESDAEGLCYYKKMNALLVACKNSSLPAHDWNTVDEKKAIYIFDLNKKVILPDPLFVLDFSSIMNESGNTVYMNYKLKPSGIAVHPVSGHIYIISSVGNLLVEVTTKGEIVTSAKLDKNLFQQPEGICFLSNGDMFISNEGRGGKGTILKFKYNH